MTFDFANMLNLKGKSMKHSIRRAAGDKKRGQVKTSDSCTKLHGPRFYKALWAAVLELHYGDASDAEKWMREYWPPFDCVPIELTSSLEGRNKILAEVERLERFRLETHPITYWRTCTALRPTEFDCSLVFRGTDILAVSLFSVLSKGGTINDFFAVNPTVNPILVETLFEHIYLDLCKTGSPYSL